MNCIQTQDGGKVGFEFIHQRGEKKKPYQQSPTVFACPPQEFIPVYQFCTDNFILQMAGTQLNYLNQPAKNNMSDIIAHRRAGCREKKIHTAYPIKYPIAEGLLG